MRTLSSAFMLFALTATGAAAQTATTFVPVAPCRVLDTRLQPISEISGRFLAGDARSIAVRGATTDFSSQGGNPSGCGVPTNAVAVAINFVAVAPLGDGHLTAWPGASLPPTASVLNFTNGVNIANQVPLLLNTACVAVTCPPLWQDFAVYVAVGSTHVVADVYGYYLATP